MIEIDNLPDDIRSLIAVQPSGCWLWLGSLSNGYGNAPGSLVLRYGIADTQVHVFVWRMLVGAIPRGWHLHHMCEIRRCCHPDPRHVQLLTPAEHQAWHYKTRQLRNKP